MNAGETLEQLADAVSLAEQLRLAKADTTLAWQQVEAFKTELYRCEDKLRETTDKLRETTRRIELFERIVLKLTEAAE